MLIYAACSASFFARLTGSPFILHDMGYSPAAIGLSYVPQTIAFRWVAMAVAPRCKMGRPTDAALLVLYALSVIATGQSALFPAPGLQKF